MTLYTLVNEREKVGSNVTFDPFDESAVIPEISSMSIIIGMRKRKQIYLAFESREKAQCFADSLNKRGDGKYLLSPRRVSEGAERDYRAKLQSGELVSDYKEIEKALKRFARRRWLRRNRAILIGASIGALVGWLGDDIYYNVKASYLANQGSAYVRIYDSDGLEAIVLTNNTADNPDLTRIPPLALQNLYTDNLRVTFPHLRSGHYVFHAGVADNDGNIECRTIEMDIENPRGGVDSLYGSEVVIDNERLPCGKERFRLGE
jgi:hypothetical protein